MGSLEDIVNKGFDSLFEFSVLILDMLFRILLKLVYPGVDVLVVGVDDGLHLR